MNNFNGTVLRNISGKLGTSVFILLALVLLSSHDLYLKMESYFLEPGQIATISLYNGTFEKSENIITRDRMSDASMVINGQRSAIQPDQWRDQDSTITQLPFTPNETGTYLVGVSTKARNIELTAEKFNSYLEHDGVLDMLDYRTENDLLDQDAVESYQKHVKAIYQVGNTKTADWKTVLDYPIEFVPQANPYEKYSGDQLEVKLLMDGKTLANQLVYADYLASAHSHGHDHGHDHEDHAHDHGNGAHQHAHDEASGETHSHTSGQQLRTDDRGLIMVDLPEEGIYYLRTIYMENVMNDDTLTHRSKWATLTFEIGHQHGDETHSHGEHGHEHPHEHGLPIWAWMLGGVVVLGLLLLLFKRRGA